MKTSYASAIVLALSALAAGHAVAADGPAPYSDIFPPAATADAAAGKTRAQVLAELADAQRTGDIVANGGGEKTSDKLNQVNPSRYAAQQAAPGKTRGQVLAELAAAQRSGDIVANLGGARGNLKLSQLFETEVSTD